jgi:hypothetical protein
MGLFLLKRLLFIHFNDPVVASVARTYIHFAIGRNTQVAQTAIRIGKISAVGSNGTHVVIEFEQHQFTVF